MLLNDESEYGHVRLHLYLQECAVARNVCKVLCVIIPQNVQAVFCQCTIDDQNFLKSAIKRTIRYEQFLCPKRIV